MVRPVREGPKYLVVVLALVHCAGKILMVRRRDEDAGVKELSWVFPGGVLEENQDPTEAAVAEAKSEAGLEVEVRRLLFARKYPRTQTLLLYYECLPKNLEQGALVGEPDELDHLCWVPAERVVSEYAATDVHPVIQEFLHEISRTNS